MNTLELLQQAEMGIWHRPAQELVVLAVREIMRLREELDEANEALAITRNETLVLWNRLIEQEEKR